LASVKARRIPHKAETGCDPLRRQIGPRIFYDLVTDSEQRCDEQDLKGEPSPSRAAAERPLQQQGELRRSWSGLDAPRRGRLFYSADRRRVLNSALVPELIEPAGNA